MEEAKFPTPIVTLSIFNQTQNNLALMQGDKILAKIKKNSLKKNIKISVQQGEKFGNRIIYNSEHPLTIVDTQKNKNYLVGLLISKGPNAIGLNCDLQRISTEDDLKQLVDPKLNEEEFKKELDRLKERERYTTITSIKESIKQIKTAEVQDSYNIELILKGDNLQESEIDYTGSLS